MLRIEQFDAVGHHRGALDLESHNRGPGRHRGSPRADMSTGGSVLAGGYTCIGDWSFRHMECTRPSRIGPVDTYKIDVLVIFDVSTRLVPDVRVLLMCI